MANKKGSSSKAKGDFVKKLVRYCQSLKKLAPNQVYVFNVIARHGSYQVKIGAEYSPEECKKLGTAPHTRRIEINGNMPHLFINPKNISPLPKHEDIKTNLKGSVIMKDVSFRIIDAAGKIASVKVEKYDENGIWARRRINLAGDKGDEMVDKLTTSGRLILETYLIIQEDILDTIMQDES